MSNSVNKIKDQMNEESRKRDARSSLLGVVDGKNETAATSEEENKNENNNGNPFASIAASLGDNDEVVEPKKVLKGIYLDPDVLAVYNEKSGEKKRKRGWGSQLTSDLLRAYFESQGWMDKK